MIEFEQLIHLIAFDEYKTLSRAAKELHISQPVLTRSMQKLEETLDLTLFERTKNRMYLKRNWITCGRTCQKNYQVNTKSNENTVKRI